MPASIVSLSTYQKRVAKLLTEQERTQMECFISQDPERHPVIPGTGGFRKARWGRQGRGKSGGVRVIYYFWITPDIVYLADVYANNEKENLTDADKKALQKIAAELKKSVET
jgi:mRNA-degrading endonuclease RelE of RelBE toxin-antitoxin system